MGWDVERIIAACSDDALDAGITIRAELQPLAGPGAPVKPAIYAGGVYQYDRRWVGEGDAREPVTAIVIDNVPSQVNRLEAALCSLRGRLGLPEIVVDLGSVGPLPPHLPSRLSSYRFPHRQADAYLRDSMLGGQPFLKTDVGAAVAAATAERPGALLEWFPQALLFGFWQSHLGKKGSQAKLARSWTSEIVGLRPAVGTDPVQTKGVKGDPLNLQGDEQDVEVSGFVDYLDADKKKTVKLSEVGHGQAIFPGGNRPAALAPVSFASIEQRASVSFAALRRLHADAPPASAVMRALLVGLGVVAHAAAFGRSFSLRSGCELCVAHSTWTLLGSAGDEELGVPDVADAIELFGSLAARAESAGLPAGRSWASEPLVLEPSETLAKVIRDTYPLEP